VQPEYQQYRTNISRSCVQWNHGREQVVLAGNFFHALQAALLGFDNKIFLPVEIDPAVTEPSGNVIFYECQP